MVLGQIYLRSSCVIHLAALADIVPSIENPKEYFNSNVVGTFNVLNAANEHNVKKFIYSASSSCYGLPEQIPTKETSANDPRYPYALTKLMGEDLVMHWSQVYGINAISLRFFNVYGTRSRTSGTYGAVFGVFLAQKLANQPYTVVGDGTQTRDFTYVSDVADAVFAAVNANLKKEIINIGSDNTYSINDLVNLLDGEVVYIPKRPGEPDCTWADISKAKDLLNWSPSVSLQAGVTKLIENIDYWKQAPVWDEQSIANATKKAGLNIFENNKLQLLNDLPQILSLAKKEKNQLFIAMEFLIFCILGISYIFKKLKLLGTY